MSPQTSGLQPFCCTRAQLVSGSMLVCVSVYLCMYVCARVYAFEDVPVPGGVCAPLCENDGVCASKCMCVRACTPLRVFQFQAAYVRLCAKTMECVFVYVCVCGVCARVFVRVFTCARVW